MGFFSAILLWLMTIFFLKKMAEEEEGVAMVARPSRQAQHAVRYKDDQEGFVSVPLRDDPTRTARSGDPALLIVADHHRMEATGRTEEDPEIRAFVDRQIELEKEGRTPLILAEPPDSIWDISQQLQPLIEETYDQFVDYCNGDRSSGWHPVPHQHRRQEWSILEKEMPDGTVRMKVQGIMRAHASRIARLNRDLNYDTRSRWDGADVKPLVIEGPDGEKLMINGIRRRGNRLIKASKSTRAKLEKSNSVPLSRCFEILESYVHPPDWAAALGVAVRRVLMVQWGEFLPEKREYVLLTRTLEDAQPDERYFPLPGGCVDCVGWGGMRLRMIKGERGTTDFTMVVNMSPGGMIPATLVNWYKERFLDRAQLIEDSCQDDVYLPIYGKRVLVPVTGKKKKKTKKKKRRPRQE